jgi:hypothetical protein
MQYFLINLHNAYRLQFLHLLYFGPFICLPIRVQFRKRILLLFLEMDCLFHCLCFILPQLLDCFIDLNIRKAETAFLAEGFLLIHDEVIGMG